tara:strand:- start:58 stop:288 length:231 start_codon:yes stop_codon:yes gene_type:complete
MEKSNIITINGTEYSQDDLNEDQTYLINQIKDLQGKSANIRFQLDQISVAQSAFTNSLVASLKNEEVVKSVNESRN